MGLPSSPPPYRTPQQNHATLLVSWWATISALFIILVRVIGRYIRTEKLFMEDKMMAWAAIPLMIRMGLVHVVLLYGTNNTITAGLTDLEISQREIGSKVVLAARIFYAMFIWLSKLTVSEFLKRLTTASWNRRYELVLQGIRIFLLLTFIGVVIGTLTECQPFDHYWQIIPDPGPACRNGYAQLFVMGVCDIVTDVVLIIFPLPVLLRSSMPVKRKISLCLLYSLSVFLIAIAAYRIPAIVSVHGRQQRRSLWASIEILASAACSNAVIIGSFVRDRGVKKQKYKRGDPKNMESVDAPSFNRSCTMQHWGNDSDEDLFKSVRGRMNSVVSRPEIDLTKKDALAPMPTIHSPRHQPADDPENAITVWNPREAHASEDLSLQDPGGLLGEGSRIRSSKLQSGSAALTPSKERALSPASSSTHYPQTVSGSQESLRASSVAEPVEVRRYQAPLPPNGRPRGPGDDLELNDAGGLLT